MQKIIIVGGPTATGKTNFALNLAQKLNGELINADSRQLYKYLNIGTNKGDILTSNNEKFLDEIKIHLIDFLDLKDRFSVFEWREAAIEAINEIDAKAKTPIVVGGTGLYIDSLLKNYEFKNDFKISDHQSSKLKELNLENLNEVQILLKQNFPEIWRNLNFSDSQNLRRLQRIVQKISSSNNPAKPQPKMTFTSEFYYPKYDWEDLKLIIDARVEEMFKQGLVNETRGLLNMGYNQETSGLNIIGYKEVVRYLNKEISLLETIGLVKIAHKQYARRQRTWFEGVGRGYNLNIVDFKNNL